MTREAGDDLDCPYCDATHEVRRSRGVRVKGFAQRVPATLYAECPEAGYLAIDEDGEVDMVSGDGEPGHDGERVEGRGRDDWP